ncbi:MAG: HEPN domain-containing protein [Candidatus Nanoarchaeia archaeon]|nr:HEPN domain-containing protein [Candidatus Nanoarchaeia archaeon]
MGFDKKYYKEEFENLLKEKNKRKFYIKESNSLFKINRYIKKGTESLELAGYIKNSDKDAKSYWVIIVCYYSMLYMAKAAILTKGYETDDHYATQIALGHLMVPGEIEKEDLELLEQSYKIFEEDYIDYFDDARKESSVSRYSATKVYNERRVKEIFENARKFISKLRIILK